MVKSECLPSFTFYQLFVLIDVLYAMFESRMQPHVSPHPSCLSLETVSVIRFYFTFSKSGMAQILSKYAFATTHSIHAEVEFTCARGNP